MRVSWDDIGRSTEEGEWEVRGQTVSVTWRQIEIWKQHPDAVFTATYFAPVSGTARWVLGSYELPDD
jgi:hypothetical protein